MNEPHPDEYVDAAGEREFEELKNLITVQKISVSVIIGFLILVFLSLDWMTAESFQRLGSMGVALGVLILLVLRWLHDRVEQTRQISANYSVFAAIKESTGWDAQISLSSKYADILAERDYAARNSRFFYLLTAFLEGGLIVISTLQWGYGDLFHCWYNDKGWTSC